jgi:hypothetical protein
MEVAMFEANTHPAEVMPLLSSGRHRSPRQGACFMEFASYLAGERWSDHPPCTHPALASLARAINDLTSDAERGALLPWVHRVVGLTGDDPHLASELAARAGRAAMPIVSMERQNAIAVGLIALASRTDDEMVTQLVAEALESAPQSERWALGFLGRGRVAGDPVAATDAVVRTSVIGIALACVEDPDAHLRTLLGEAIEASERRLSPATAPQRELVDA